MKFLLIALFVILTQGCSNMSFVVDNGPYNQTNYTSLTNFQSTPPPPPIHTLNNQMFSNMKKYRINFRDFKKCNIAELHQELGNLDYRRPDDFILVKSGKNNSLFSKQIKILYNCQTRQDEDFIFKGVYYLYKLAKSVKEIDVSKLFTKKTEN